MNIVFTCGGTGGHIYPAIAVARMFRERQPDCRILFIGAEDGMENLENRRLLFAVALDPSGCNLAYYGMLRALRGCDTLLRGSVAGVIVTGVGEFYTKDVARDMVFAANQAGCAFLGRPLVEATGSLRNFRTQAQIGGVDEKTAFRLAVEELVKKFFIVRIAWVFGVNGKNFIKTMLRIGKERGAATVVDDQIGSPTYTYDLARLLVDMIQTEKYGRYHATNEGLCSWYEFACEIFRQAGLPVQVDAVTTAEYGASKAARPFNSRLDKSKLAENGFTPLPEWKDALSRYLRELGDNQ